MTAPFYVEILAGNREVRNRYRVDALPIRIGRAYDNDIILDDPHASSHHAIVVQGADGGLVVRDTGSRNSILHKRKRLTELSIDGNTVFKLGHVSLRIRASDFQVSDEIMDRSFHNWEGWPPALSGLVLLVCFSAVGVWLETTEKFEAVSFFMPIVVTVCLGMIWCGGWVFANRLFGGNARFGRHLFILGVGFAAMTIWSMASSAIAYSFSWEMLTRYGSHVVIAIFAGMVFFHLRNIKPVRHRQFAVICIVLSILCSGVRVMINYRFNGIPADELVMHERMPPSMRGSSDQPVSRLISDAGRLKSMVDRERSKLVSGEETDNDDQD